MVRSGITAVLVFAATFLSGIVAPMHIAVGIYGEIERWDPLSSTIPSQLVTPLSHDVHNLDSGGRLDVLIVAQQSLRERLSTERFRERWANLERYTPSGARLVSEGMKSAFLHAGADAVSVTLYELGREGMKFGGSIARQDPKTGACVSRGCLRPHDTPSVRAHLYARFRLLLAIRASEDRQRLALDLKRGNRRYMYDWVVVARNDGRWFGPAKGPDAWPANAVLTKECGSWSGLNDKFSVVPRARAEAWLDTESDLQNASLRFSSVETLLLAIAGRDNMQVNQVTPDVFPVVDFYWWSNCFPLRYAHWFNSRKECEISGTSFCDPHHAAIGLPRGTVKHLHPVLSAEANKAVAALGSAETNLLPTLTVLGSLDIGNASVLTLAGDVRGGPGCSSCGCLPTGMCGLVNAALCPRMDHHVCPKEQEQAMALERKRENQRAAMSPKSTSKTRPHLRKDIMKIGEYRF